MEPSVTIKECWDFSRKRERSVKILSADYLHGLLRKRISRERGRVFEFFWASLIWQITVYAFALHFAIRFFGDVKWMVLSLLAILLYLPFTVLLMEKFKRMASAQQSNDMLTHARDQQARISEFFRFKKGFDLISIPVICFLIVTAIFKLYVPGGLEAHAAGSLITYVLVLTPFILASRNENQKRFREPLEELDQIIKDLSGDESRSL